MNGQYLCNRAISISYAFKKDSKGERHGRYFEYILNMVPVLKNFLNSQQTKLIAIFIILVLPKDFLLHKIPCLKRIDLINYLRMHPLCLYLHRDQEVWVECLMAYLHLRHPVNQACLQCPLHHLDYIIRECRHLRTTCHHDHLCLQCLRHQAADLVLHLPALLRGLVCQ